jgi:hypothetical protein
MSPLARRMSRRLAFCLVLLVGAAACTPVTLPSYAPISRTPAPLPSAATALVLRVAPPAASGPGPNWACAGSTPVTVGVLLDGDAVVFATVTGERIDLVWPRGFSARLLAGRVEIVAPDGAVVARDGDELPSGTLGGSPSGTQAEPGFDICQVNGDYYPPAS